MDGQLTTVWTIQFTACLEGTLHWSLERSGRVEIVNRTKVLPIKWTSRRFPPYHLLKLGCVSVGTSLELFSLHLSFSISVVMFRCRCVAVDFISIVLHNTMMWISILFGVTATAHVCSLWDPHLPKTMCNVGHWRHGELGVEIEWLTTDWERKVTGRHLLFGNVGFDFSDASGNIRGLSCPVKWMRLNGAWLSPLETAWTVLGSGNLFYETLKRNRNYFSLWVVIFHFCLWTCTCCLGSQAGQVWLSLLGRLQFVFCETWNGCSREVLGQMQRRYIEPWDR